MLSSPSTSTPKPFPVQKLDFVAPYWFDESLFLNKTGNASAIYYRETNHSFLLTRATREIRKAFSNDFSATHLFIVTWVIADHEADSSEMVIVNAIIYNVVAVLFTFS